MPIASPEVYAEMLDRAKAGAVRVPRDQRDLLADAERGAAGLRRRGERRHHPGLHRWRRVPVRSAVKDMVTGAVAFAAFAHEVAKKYPVNIALHTDHCPKDKLDKFVRPLLAISKERVRDGEEPLFQSHMWDGSAVPLDGEPGDRRRSCSPRPPPRKIVLEIEVGVVGGEEDGVANAINEKLYTTVEDGLAMVERARPGREGPLHGGADLRQRARRLQAGQRQAPPGDPQGDPGRRSAPSTARRSRSTWSSTAAPARCCRRSATALDYGVVKMNIDTDTQYAFTRPVADHMFTQLRRRAEDRRRGRQQEGVRPAHLGQGGRGGHGQAGRRGVRGPALDRHHAVQVAPHQRRSFRRRAAAAAAGTSRSASSAAASWRPYSSPYVNVFSRPW